MNNAINVDLYGDGSRSARLRAEYIYCDYAEECTAYKQGQCFAVSAFLQPRCKLGKVSSVDGGLKRSKKFDKVYSEAKDNENYHKLEFPLDLYFAKVNEKMYVAIPHICVKALDDGNIKVDDPSFGIDSCIFENKHITSDNFIKILEFHPQAIFGGEITNYQNKIVPMLLFQLKRYLPELYAEIIKKRPKFEKFKPSWIGKRAKLATCNRDMKYKDSQGNVFHFEGEYIVCNDYKSAFLPFRANNAAIRIKVTDNMPVEITDNKQVLEDTVFR